MRPGERIKILRILNGMTQEQLADLAGVNRASMVSWERGNYNPSGPAAASISESVLCPPGYIMFGSPVVESAVWEPCLPHRSKYLKQYYNDIESLFPQFCKENKINKCAFCSADNGSVVFFGREDNTFEFMQFLSLDLVDSFIRATADLDKKELSGAELLTIGFLKEENVETIARYFNIARANTIYLDHNLITTAFLKAKKSRGIQPGDDTKKLVRSAFTLFHTILQEYEKPTSWAPNFIDPRNPTLLDQLGIVFEWLYEKIETESKVWDGDVNSDLANIIRKHLESRGFKKRNHSIKVFKDGQPHSIDWDF